MPFWMSKADQNGARITAADLALSPGPTSVEYPKEALGAILDTADGRVIQQQPAKDGRRRAWIWTGYPNWLATYTTLWDNLESLRATLRKGYGAATPWVYLKEDITGEFRRQATYLGTATSGAVTTLTDTGATFPGSNGLAGYRVEILQGTGAGQYRTVVSNTGTQVTVATWTVNPDNTSKYAIRGWVFDWFKVRVVNVSRQVRASAAITYEETRMEFVVEDSTWNYVG